MSDQREAVMASNEVYYWAPEFRWLKWLLGRHRHRWQHMETHRLLPYEYRDCHIICQVMGRTLYYRECAECDAWGQYYPSNDERERIKMTYPIYEHPEPPKGDDA